MKTFILISIILFVTGVSCKKVNPLCGCSPVVGPELMLVVKNSSGDDLLNSKTLGSFSKDDIRLFKKEANGTETQLGFAIRPPFSYGNNNFTFYSIYTTAFPYATSGQGSFYLKIGDTPAYKLTAEIAKLGDNVSKLNKLLIDDKEAERDNGTVANYATIFYFVK